LLALTKFAKLADHQGMGFFQGFMKGWEQSATETMVIISSSAYIMIILLLLK